MSVNFSKSMADLHAYDADKEAVTPPKPKRKSYPPIYPNPIFVPPHPLRKPDMDNAAIQQAVHNVWPNVHFGD